jgi:hypothetical protein
VRGNTDNPTRPRFCQLSLVTRKHTNQHRSTAFSDSFSSMLPIDQL